MLSVEINKRQKIKFQQRQLSNKCIFAINNILLHTNFRNLYEMSVDDSYVTYD